MSDRHLRHVVALARAGSFTKAAGVLGITQPGLTKSIADLERALGFSLFYRTPHGVLATEKGREFVERAGRVLEDTRVLMTGEGEEDPYAQVLRIGVFPASLEWLLSEPLATVLHRHPTMIFDVVGSDFERGIRLLRTGVVDVALGFDDAFSEWSDVKRTPISALHGVLFVRRGHPIVKRRVVSRAHFARYDFVAPSDSRPYGSVIRELYERAGVSWRRRIHVIDYFPIVKRIVATSDAIGVTTRDYAKTAAFAALFERVPGVSPFPPAAMCCAIRARWPPSAPVKALLRVIKERLPPA